MSLAQPQQSKTDELHALSEQDRGERSYTEALAESLILYSQNDERFARWLRTRLKAVLSVPSGSDRPTLPSIGEHAKLLLPFNRDYAERRTQWLLKNFSERHLMVASEAIVRLATWARNKTRPDPKSLIVGIIGLAIPGFTLGLIKRNVSMKVIVSQAFTANHNNLSASPAITSATLGVLKQGLESAQHNTRKLEPELADWFFGERTISLYTADEDEVQTIRAELNNSSIPHEAITETGGMDILAVSPVVNHVVQHLFWNLRLLNVTINK